MCESIADIESVTAEIRRGIEKDREKKKKPQGKNIMSASATHGGHKKAIVYVFCVFRCKRACGI